MLMSFAAACRRHSLAIILAASAAVAGSPAAAQAIQTIDPNTATAPAPAAPDAIPAPSVADLPPASAEVSGDLSATTPAVPGATQAVPGETYKQDDLIGAAEGVFGKGAEGLARIIQDVLKKQGEPNAYIVGREAGGAFVVGARYGSGTLFHKVEGQLPVYWTGPSVGFDVGANAGSTFVLVYNLYNTDDLYNRFPAGEGQLYFVGGFNASYVRRGNIVLIPIRVGAGLRVGINAGYLKFTRKQDWLPF